MNKATYKSLGWLLLVFLLITGSSMTVFAAETDEEKIRLNKPNQSGNTAFSVENMFPGDAVSKEVTVKVKHKEPIILYYCAEIRPEYEKLAEVMMVKIELSKKNITLYDGLMRDMPGSLEHLLAADEKEITYRITAYLDTSVGNEYQYQRFVADFYWWYAEEPDSEKPDDEKPDDGKQERPIPSDSQDDPKTGDNSNILLYIVMVLGALSVIFFLLILKKQKKEEETDE